MSHVASFEMSMSIISSPTYYPSFKNLYLQYVESSASANHFLWNCTVLVLATWWTKAYIPPERKPPCIGLHLVCVTPSISGLQYLYQHVGIEKALGTQHEPSRTQPEPLRTQSEPQSMSISCCLSPSYSYALGCTCEHNSWWNIGVLQTRGLSGGGGGRGISLVVQGDRALRWANRDMLITSPDLPTCLQVYHCLCYLVI